MVKSVFWCRFTKPFLHDGPLIVLPADASAKDYFNLLFPTALWKTIVSETNHYIQQKGKPFVETFDAEMKAFIGLTMAMGIHRLPRIENYWNSLWVLNIRQFTQIFTLKRYWFLWSSIHLVDNTQCVQRDHPDHDRLFKVRPLILKLNDTFPEHYRPQQNISVDESMVRFKGRS